MKVVEFFLALAMVVVSLGLVFAYAKDGSALFSLAWAGVAALNMSNAALKGVVIWVEKF